MVDLTQNTVLPYVLNAMEQYQRAKALAKELDYLKQSGVIDEQQYNILLDSPLDYVEKIIPKIYENRLKEMQMKQEAELKQAELAQKEQAAHMPHVELIRTEKGVEMITYDPMDPVGTAQVKLLSKREAKKVVDDLSKKYKVKVIGSKVVYIPPTPEGDVKVRDLPIPETSPQKGTATKMHQAAKQSAAMRLKKLGGLFGQTVVADTTTGDLYGIEIDPATRKPKYYKIGNLTQAEPLQAAPEPMKPMEEDGGLFDWIKEKAHDIYDFFTGGDEKEISQQLQNEYQQMINEPEETYNPFNGDIQ